MRSLLLILSSGSILIKGPTRDTDSGAIMAEVNELTNEVRSDIRDKLIHVIIHDIPKRLLVAGRKGATEESAQEVIKSAVGDLDSEIEGIIDKHPLVDEKIREQIDAFRKTLTGT
jgi:hypothetical protein